MGPRVARSVVHAAFGLINSTPFSGRLRRDAMVELLERMAHGALTSIIESPTSSEAVSVAEPP